MMPTFKVTISIISKYFIKKNIILPVIEMFNVYELYRSCAQNKYFAVVCHRDKNSCVQIKIPVHMYGFS
jgi:hypothetical protein